ncbi:MAG: hypothetical protein MKZ56_07545, partial [Candidatus Thalassarchaeum sp.]|nr:hypothetical protein [Candidatus Thalassarchaeum sp.]
ADVGGNCELSSPREIVTTEYGGTIIGTTNLPGLLSSTASMLYSNNLTTFVGSLMTDGELVIDPEDDILFGAPEGSDFYVSGMGGVLVCMDGQIHEKQTRLTEVVE